MGLIFLAEVNILAVLVSTIVYFILGFLWYGFLFKSLWIKGMKFNKKELKEMQKKSMIVTSIVHLIVLFITVYVLGIFVQVTGAVDFAGGVSVSFLMWLGFVATLLFSQILYEGRGFSLFLINSIYNLLGLVLSGIILALW